MLKKIINFIKEHNNLFLPLIMSLTLASTSCFIIFKEEFDLSVYKQMIETMQSFNNKDLINYIFYRFEIISMSYFYVMGQIGLDNYIQVIPTFIFYYIMFYIIIDYAQINNYKKRNIVIVIVLFLALFKYMNIATCIRNNLAFSMFLLGLYFEIIKRKTKRAYIMYIMSCLVHTSLWPILILKELLRVNSKKIFMVIMIIILIFVGFPQIPISLLNISNVEFLKVVSGRLETYILNGEIHFTIQYLFRIMQFIALSIFVLYSLYKYNTEEKLKRFSIAIFIISISLINKYWIFLRFTDFSLFISLIPILTLLEKMPNNIYKKIVFLGLFLMTIVGIRIQLPTFTNMFIE